MPPSPRVPNPIFQWLLAALVGAGVLWASDLLVPPAAAAFVGHGERFQAMTHEPLALAGEFPQRILWPLLAWLCGLGGDRAPVFAQVVNGAFLAVVYWFVRQRLPQAGDALLVTIAVAATGAVLVYKPMACLSDPLNFLLLLLALHHVQRPVVCWGLVLLSAFSHEMSFFLAPWLVWQRCRHGGVWWRELGWLGAAAAVFAGWLWFVREAGTGASYGFLYYLSSNFWVPWGLPALWALWGLAMLVEFGPLLVVVVWAARVAVPGVGRQGLVLLFASLLPTTLLAYDVMRFAAFLFLPLLPAAIALLRAPRGRPAFVVLLVAAITGYRLLHPNPTEAGGRAYVHVGSIAHDLLAQDLARGVEPLATLGDALAYHGALLARTWDVWAAALAGTVAVAAAGLWLARYVRPAGAAAGSEPRTTQNASP
jgi:hypothetical protein